MNRTGLFLGIVAIAAMFAACQPYRMVSLDTYRPATVTFPSEIKQVMIVNNAAQQPDDFGHQVIGSEKGDSAFSISADSLAYHFCLALGKAIAESPLFEDVRICDDTIRTDSLFMVSRPLKQGEVLPFCENYGVDALITLDKLYFKTSLFNIYQRALYNLRYISVEINGELRALYPDSPVAFTVPFVDTLAWTLEEEYFPSSKSAAIAVSKQDIKIAMRVLSEYMGESLHIHFVPHWSAVDRWYYTSMLSGWKQATAYAFAGKWPAATAEWLRLYSKATKWQHKARLASNLALCYEIAGDFAKAVAFAQEASALFEQKAPADDAKRKKQQEYFEQLTKRQEDDRTLSIQLREVD